MCILSHSIDAFIVCEISMMVIILGNRRYTKKHIPWVDRNSSQELFSDNGGYSSGKYKVF